MGGEVTMDIQDLERVKYEKVWSNRDYARQADGEPVVDYAFSAMECKPGETLMDWGCGCGRPAAKFQDKGLKVFGFDIAHNCLDANLRERIPLIVGTIWDPPINMVATDYAFSTDVLEHLPTERLELALDHMMTHTRKAVFIQVCCLPDSYGATMDPPQILHLSVKPPEWWRQKIAKRWRITYDTGSRKKGRWCFVGVRK